MIKLHIRTFVHKRTGDNFFPSAGRFHSKRNTKLQAINKILYIFFGTMAVICILISHSVLLLLLRNPNAPDPYTFRTKN